MKNGKNRIVTTSWDDGDLRDLKVAELLRSRGMSGTFYVPIEPFSSECPSLNKEQMRSMIAEGLEIGGHGVAHEIMTEVPANDLYRIVSTCKAIHEDTLGQRVRMFCYPRGRYTRHAVEAVKKAGYEGGRTVQLLATENIYYRFTLPTSVQVFRHGRSAYLRNIARNRSASSLYNYVTRFGVLENWVELGKRLFDRVMQEGGIWHLWGHSWEVDKHGLWDEMSELLDYVKGRDNVLYLNNGDVVQHLADRSS